MNSKIYSILVSLAVLSIASARAPRDAPKVDEFSFKEFSETATKNLQDFGDNLLKLFGVENTDQLQQKAVDNGKQFAGKLDEWAKEIKTQADSFADSKAVTELRASVDKAINEFNLKNPQTAEEIKQYVASANKGAEEVFAKLKTLGESQEATQVKEAAKKLASTAGDTFTNIVKEMQQEAAKKQ